MGSAPAHTIRRDGRRRLPGHQVRSLDCSSPHFHGEGVALPVSVWTALGKRLSSALAETHLRRESGRGDVGWLVGMAEVVQDLLDRRSFQDGGDELELTLAARAARHIDREDAGQELGPTHAAGTLVPIFRWIRRCGSQVLGRLLLRHDLGSDLGVRGQAAEEACQMDPRLGDESR